MTNYTPAQLEAWAGLKDQAQIIAAWDRDDGSGWFLETVPDLARLVLEKDAEIARLKAAAEDLVGLCHADIKMNGTTYQPMPCRSAFTKAVERLIELINEGSQAMKETSDE